MRVGIDEPWQNDAVRALMNNCAICRLRRLLCRTHINDLVVLKDDQTGIEAIVLSIEWEDETTVQMDAGHIAA